MVLIMKISLIACGSILAIFFCRMYLCLTACLPPALNESPAAVGVEVPVVGVIVLVAVSSSSSLPELEAEIDFASSAAS